MHNHRRLFAFLVAPLMLALMTSGCSSGPPPALAKNSWVLAELPGKTLVPGSNVTLAFDKDGIKGNSGCNSYGGQYKVDGSNLSFSGVASTLRACADGQMMQQESEFLGALQRTTQYRIDGSNLVLLNSDGDTLLILKPGS